MNDKKRRAVMASLALDGSIKLAADRAGIDTTKVYSLLQRDDEVADARQRGLSRARTKERDELVQLISIAEKEMGAYGAEALLTRNELFKKAPTLGRGEVDILVRGVARCEASRDEWKKRRAELETRLREWKEEHGE